MAGVTKGGGRAWCWRGTRRAGRARTASALEPGLHRRGELADVVFGRGWPGTASPAASSRGAGTVDHPELEHRREIVAGCPVFAKPATGDAIPVALVGDEALTGRWRHAAEASEIGAFGPDAGDDQLALGDDRLDRHPEIGELCAQPLDDTALMRRAVDLPGLLPAERFDSVFDVLLGHELPGQVQVLLIEDVLKEPPNQVLACLGHVRRPHRRSSKRATGTVC